MDTGKNGIIIITVLFIVFGLLFLFWFALDRWLSWKGKRRMRSNHIHHIILGAWPFLTTYLGFHFYGKYPFLIGLIFVIMTAVVYFFLSLWDIRYERINENIQNEFSPLLFRVAMSYPLLMMTVSSIVLTGGLSILIITLLHLSGDIRSYIAFLALGCDYLVIHLIFTKKIPFWEKNALENRLL